MIPAIPRPLKLAIPLAPVLWAPRVYYTWLAGSWEFGPGKVVAYSLDSAGE